MKHNASPPSCGVCLQAHNERPESGDVVTLRNSQLNVCQLDTLVDNCLKCAKYSAANLVAS
jgi:hypothetical protein